MERRFNGWQKSEEGGNSIETLLKQEVLII